MTGLTGKRWYFFVWDADNEVHLGRHHITPEEAEEVFFNRYIIPLTKRSMDLDVTALMEEPIAAEGSDLYLKI